MYVNKIWKGVLNHAEVDLLSNGYQRAGSALGADIGEPGLGQEKRAISLASLPPAQMQNTVCILLRVPPRGLNST